MARLTLTQENLQAREILPLLGEDISHFNLVFYRTHKVPADDYAALPDHIGTDIIPADKLIEAERVMPRECGDVAVGVSSLVRIKNGRSYHIKQLDIDADMGTAVGLMNFTERLINAMKGDYRRIGDVSGFLANSGSGMHYYETGLLSETEWHQWIETAGKLQPVVDKEWVNLSRRRGYSTLRINSTAEKARIPVVFCRFSYK